MNHSSKTNRIRGRFADLAANRRIVKYEDVMLKISATELRAMIISLGEAVIRRLEKKGVGSQDDLGRAVDMLLAYYTDPIADEKKIFTLYETLKKQYGLSFDK